MLRTRLSGDGEGSKPLELLKDALNSNRLSREDVYQHISEYNKLTLAVGKGEKKVKRLVLSLNQLHQDNQAIQREIRTNRRNLVLKERSLKAIHQEALRYKLRRQQIRKQLKKIEVQRKMVEADVATEKKRIKRWKRVEWKSMFAQLKSLREKVVENQEEELIKLDDISTYQRKIQDSRDKMTLIEQLTSKERETLLNLESSLVDIRTIPLQLESRLELCTDRVKKKEKEVEALESVIDDQFEEEILDLKEGVRSERQTYASLRSYCLETQQGIRKLDHKIDLLQKEVEEKNLHKEKIRERIAKCRKSCVEQQFRNESTLNELRRLKFEKKQLVEDVESIEKRLKFMTDQMKLYSDDEKQLFQEKVDLFQFYTKKKKELNVLDESVVDLIGKHFKANMKEQKQQQRLSKMEGTLEEGVKRRQSLVEEQKDEEDMIKALNARRTEMKRTIDEEKRRFVHMTSHLSTLKTEFGELKKEVRDCIHESIEGKQSIKKIQKCLKDYSDKILENRHMGRVFKEKIMILDCENRAILKNRTTKEKSINKIQMEKFNCMKLTTKKKQQRKQMELDLEFLKDQLEMKKSKIKKNLLCLKNLEHRILKLKQSQNQRMIERNMLAQDLSKVKEENLLMNAKVEVTSTLLDGAEKKFGQKMNEKRGLEIALRGLETNYNILCKKKQGNEGIEKKKKEYVEELQKLQDYCHKLSWNLSIDKGSQVRYVGGKMFMSLVSDEDKVEEEMKRLVKKIGIIDENIGEQSLMFSEITKASDKLRKSTVEWTRGNGVNEKDFLKGNIPNSMSNLLNGASISLQILQADIKKQDREMKATLSECSIAESRLIELKKKEDEIRDTLKKYDVSITSEKVPKTLKTIIKSKLRMKKYDRAISARRIQENDERTTVIQRPNSYIPKCIGSLGVPKPYGWCAPIRPNSRSANMRFYTSPRKKDPLVL